MTYEELTNRLNKVETALTALQTGSYQDLNFNVGETIQQLETIKTTLQEQIAVLNEAEVITRTNMQQDKKDVLTKAREKGVNNPEFTRKVQKAKPGDTFDLDEDHAENPNDDSDMAKIQLLQVAEYANELLHMIEDGQQLDAWIQAKITKISDYIGTVKHYLEGEEYLDGEYRKDHPAAGDEEFYNSIPEEYTKMYESWVASQTATNE